jgi:hypothetical protein
LVINGDPAQDISLVQKPSRFETIFMNESLSTERPSSVVSKWIASDIKFF